MKPHLSSQFPPWYNFHCHTSWGPQSWCSSSPRSRCCCPPPAWRSTPGRSWSVRTGGWCRCCGCCTDSSVAHRWSQTQLSTQNHKHIDCCRNNAEEIYQNWFFLQKYYPSANSAVFNPTFSINLLSIDHPAKNSVQNSKTINLPKLT